MNIFNVLKYPISFPPTREQLESVPRRTYLAWRRKVGFTDPINDYGFEAEWYQRNILCEDTVPEIDAILPVSKVAKRDIDLLRKMILRMRK